jgi:hypothetical protein
MTTKGYAAGTEASRSGGDRVTRIATRLAQAQTDVGVFARWYRDDVTALVAEHRTMLENLTSVQARCTELLLECRALRAKGIVLPGFDCVRCGAFTGTAKEEHIACRCCGEPRP